MDIFFEIEIFVSIVVFGTVPYFLFVYVIMPGYEHKKLSKQLRKICLRWKCWQLYLSINIPWKSGDSEFSWIYKGLFNSMNKLCGSNWCKKTLLKIFLVKYYPCCETRKATYVFKETNEYSWSYKLLCVFQA